MNVDFDAPQRTRALKLIAVAERYVSRRAGWDFYDPALPESLQSSDWIEVVCRVAEKMIRMDDPETKAHANGPYQSERNADYQYTLKTVGTDLSDDPEVSRIIAYWLGGNPTPIAFTTEGPSKNATPEYDPDTGTWYDITDILDISRYSVPFVGE
jgi:hypothetical protein